MLRLITLQTRYWAAGTDQRAVIGNSVTFNQDAVKLSEILPRSNDDLVKCLHVTFVGSNPDYHTICKIFTVRQGLVGRCLELLQKYCPEYYDIRIDKITLHTLPKNGIPDVIFHHATVKPANDGSQEILKPGYAGDDIGKPEPGSLQLDKTGPILFKKSCLDNMGK